MAVYEYLSTSELPSIGLRWANSDGTAVDLSSATFSLKFVSPTTGSVLLTKTSGITGYSSYQGTSPHDYNLLIQWSSGQLATSGIPGAVFSTKAGTLVLTYALSGSDSEPWNGDLTIRVTTAVS